MKKNEKMSEEQKFKISKALKGKSKSEEFKKKCSKRLKGKPSFFKGHKQSEKQKQMMRDRGGKNHYNYKGRNSTEKNRSNYMVMLRREKRGFTQELFDKILEEQNNKCAICGKEFNEDIYMLKKSADHCHKNNIPRGILCRKCNLLLGNSEDNINILKNSIKYLEKWEKES